MEKYRFNITISPEQILVTDLKTEEIFHFANQAISHRPSGKLLSLGVTKENFLQEDKTSDRQKTENELLVFSPFSVEEIQKGHALSTLEYFTGIAFNSYREQHNIWPYLPVRRFGVRLNFSDYDRIPIHIKLTFKAKLLKTFRAVDINGQDLGLDKRNIQFAEVILGLIQLIIGVPLIGVYLFFGQISTMLLKQMLSIPVLILFIILYALIAFEIATLLGGLISSIIVHKFLSPELFFIFLETRKGQWPNWYINFLTEHYVKI